MTDNTKYAPLEEDNESLMGRNKANVGTFDVEDVRDRVRFYDKNYRFRILLLCGGISTIIFVGAFILILSMVMKSSDNTKFNLPKKWSASYTATIYDNQSPNNPTINTTSGKIWLDKPNQGLRIDFQYPLNQATVSMVLNKNKIILFMVMGKMCQQFNDTPTLNVNLFAYPLFNWTYNSTNKGDTKCNWFTSGLGLPAGSDEEIPPTTFSYCLKSDGSPVFLNISAGHEGHISICMHDVSTSKIKSSVFGLPPDMGCTKITAPSIGNEDNKIKRSFETVKEALSL